MLYAGDVDGDGGVTVNDVAHIVSTFGSLDLLCDLDGDGMVTELDLIIVYQGFNKIGQTITLE
jgi:Ca2+-binding EF-hand superfamily protein